MRRYYHYKKRPRPFPVEILSAMQDDTKPTPSPMHLEASPFVECVKQWRASFEMAVSGIQKMAQRFLV